MNKIMSLVLISLFSGQLFSMNDQNNIISSKNFNEKFFTENEIKIQEIVNSGQKIVNSGQMVHPSVEEENILNFSDSDDGESSKDSEDYQDAEIFSKDKENVFFDSSFTEAEVKELKYNLKIKVEVLTRIKAINKISAGSKEN